MAQTNALNAMHNKNEFSWDEYLRSGALFSLAHSSEIVVAWGECEHAAQPNPQGLSFYNPDYYLQNKKAWKIFSKHKCYQRDEWLQVLDIEINKRQSEQEALSLQWREPDFEKFKSVFLDMQSLIAQGELKKAVPVVMSSAATAGGQYLPLLKWQQQYFSASDQQSVYGCWDAESGMMGLTPEILFSAEHDGHQVTEIRTMALAGTRASRASAGADLMNDAKERHEHQLVVQDIVHQLSPLGDVEIGETQPWNVGILTHLLTPIRLKPAPGVSLTQSFNEWVSILHPTAALGVYPRNFGWQKLKKWDVSGRQCFGAPFGILDPTHGAHVVVAIRNVQWLCNEDNNELYIGSGCGVVAQSQLEKEWEELALKRKSVRGRLQI